MDEVKRLLDSYFFKSAKKHGAQFDTMTCINPNYTKQKFEILVMRPKKWTELHEGEGSISCDQDFIF